MPSLEWVDPRTAGTAPDSMTSLFPPPGHVLVPWARRFQRKATHSNALRRSLLHNLHYLRCLRRMLRRMLPVAPRRTSAASLVPH